MSSSCRLRRSSPCTTFTTFDPLTLCSSIVPLLQTLSFNEAYSPYLTLLQRALLSRLLSQLSRVYSTFKITNLLLALVAPLGDAGLEGSFDEEQVEAYIMGCARRGELNVRVDHKEGSINFVDDPFVANDEQPTASTSAVIMEAPIQPSTANLVRTRLSSVATCLHKSLAVIEDKGPAPTAEEQAAQFKSLVTAAISNLFLYTMSFLNHPSTMNLLTSPLRILSVWSLHTLNLLKV